MTDNWRNETRLPDDPAYWDGLAARSLDGALQRNAAHGASHSGSIRTDATSFWRGVSDSAFRLAASAVLALLGGALLLGEPDARSSRQLVIATTSHTAAIEVALAPEDPLLRTLLREVSEPPADALLRLVALREGGR